MLALDLFNTKYERDLLEGGVDDLEARRIDTLNDRMQDLLARAKEPAYQANPAALAVLKKQFQQVKDERDSYYKVREAGIPGSVPTEKIPGKEDLLKGRGRSYYEDQKKNTEPVAEHGGGIGPRQHWQDLMPEQYNDDEDYEDEDEDLRLRSGDYVRDTMDGESGEIFRMQGDPYERRVRILDRDGKGWYIEPSRLTRVDPQDPDVQRYFGKQRRRDMDEGKADYNFDAEDLKRLERIRDLPTLKTQALALISKPSAKPMKPEKVEWFKNALDSMNSPIKVIKLMYDLLLSGEGHAVVGSKSSMNPNSYRQRFGEQGVAEAEKKGLYYYVNKRKKAGTSRDASSPKAPTAQAWKDAAKTAKKEDVAEGLKSGEYYIHTVYFKDGTKKRIRVTSDEFDVADYYTKRGLAVDRVDYDFQIHSDMAEAKATKTRLDPKCWTGKKIGTPKTKVKGGVRVNNCVPAESVNEDQDSSGVERAILNRIMVAHTDLLMKYGPDKVMQAAEEVAYNVGDVDEIGTSDVSAYVQQVKQILGVV
jgi:hypothetical protein